MTNALIDLAWHVWTGNGPTDEQRAATMSEIEKRGIDVIHDIVKNLVPQVVSPMANNTDDPSA